MYLPSREDFFPKLGRGHRAFRPAHIDKETGQRTKDAVQCDCWSRKNGTAKDHTGTAMKEWVEDHKGRTYYTDSKGKRHPFLANSIRDEMLRMTGY